jgi:hypothetical protein
VLIFTIEYLTRLVTAAFTRIELINQDEVVDAMCADENLNVPSRFQRLNAFVWAWPNLIDLAAILPSYITWVMPEDDEDDGGGTQVTLKLIRLMRCARSPTRPQVRGCDDHTALHETIHTSSVSLGVESDYRHAGVWGYYVFY